MSDAGYHWTRPKLLPLLFVIGAVLTLLGLGSWQVQRLEWKESMLAKIESQAKAPPVPLDTTKPPEPFQRIALHGHFLHDHEFHLAARYDHNVLGYHILTPFQLNDGRLVLLNRGWVPYNKKEPATRPEGQIPGEVALTGMVRTDSDRNTFTPEASVPKNMWFWKDVAGMEKASGLHFDGAPIDVVGMDVPGGLPKSSDGTILVRNDHLGYAITWFTLAFAAALIFVLTHFKPETEP